MAWNDILAWNWTGVASHRMAWHGRACHDILWHGIACSGNGIAWHGVAWGGIKRLGMGWHIEWNGMSPCVGAGARQRDGLIDGPHGDKQGRERVPSREASRQSFSLPSASNQMTAVDCCSLVASSSSSSSSWPVHRFLLRRFLDHGHATLSLSCQLFAIVFFFYVPSILRRRLGLEIDNFVKTHLCKLRVILQSRVLRGMHLIFMIPSRRPFVCPSSFVHPPPRPRTRLQTFRENPFFSNKELWREWEPAEAQQVRDTILPPGGCALCRKCRHDPTRATRGVTCS